MSNINIKRFVDINIVKHATSSVNSLRDTVVLLSTESSTTSDSDVVYSSLADFTSTQTIASVPLTNKYLTIFFNNNGNKVRVIYGITKDKIASTILTLPYEQIVVAYTGDYSDIKSVATTRANNSNTTDVNFAHNNTYYYGVDQKILLGRTTSELIATDTDKIANFAVKVSSEVGAEMTIAAYLSNIIIYGSNTVSDYAFTTEVITAESNEDTVLGNVLQNNANVDMTLANAIRNLGGNLKDGNDITNTFMLIVLHQTLTERILNLLASKIKDEQGLAAIQTVMADELSKYVTNGYLTTDEVWTDNDLTVTYNGQTYTVISKNTALINGYYISILPYTSLSTSDKAERKTPPIYVIVADSYGIRKITVNGEVI